VHEEVGEAAALVFAQSGAGFGGLGEFGGVELGGRGEDAELEVEDGFLDGGEGFGGLAQGGERRGFGQVHGGDVEAVQKQPGAARVDSVKGYALEDDADGGLDGGTVFGVGKDEGGLGGFVVGLELAALVEVLDGPAGGVVVEAKYFLAQADAAAAMAVGEDVTALESGGLLWI
jgi:hypothetical protein